MDLDAVLLSLAERERWMRRREVILADLERLRRRMRHMARTRKRLAKERARLSNMAANLTGPNPGLAWGTERRRDERSAPPLSSLR